MTLEGKYFIIAVLITAICVASLTGCGSPSLNEDWLYQAAPK